MRIGKLGHLGLILLLGLALRLVSLNQSLWLDEAIQAQAVITRSLPALFKDYLPGDFNPPLSYLISWLVVRLFAESEIWLRLPSVVLGTANVWLMYRLAGEVLPNSQFSILNSQLSTTQLAALLLATAPLHLYYSQEARPYILATFLVTWSMYEFWQIVKGKGSAWRMGLATFLMMLSHYLAWLMIPVQGVLLLLKGKKPLIKRWLISLGGASLLLFPWLPIFIRQIRSGAGVTQALPLWRELGTLSAKNLGLVPVKFLLGRISIDNDFVYGLVAGFLILCLGGLLVFSLVQKRKEKEEKRFLWAWLIIPLLLGALLSIKVPVFQYFRFLFVLPALYLLIVLAITDFPKRYQGLLASGLLLVNLASSLIYLVNPGFHREDWRSAVQFIHQRELNAKVIILKPVEAPFQYYDQGQAETYDYSEVDRVRFERRVWLITYAQPIFEPENITLAKLKRYGFEEVMAQDFRGVGVKYLVSPSGLTACL